MLTKLYRIYKEEQLTVRKRGGRKRALGTRAPMAIPQDQNLRWSLDFVPLLERSALPHPDRGRRLHPGMPGLGVGYIADRAAGKAQTLITSSRCGVGRSTIVSDNGTEFTSNAILAWQEELGIEWHRNFRHDIP